MSKLLELGFTPSQVASLIAKVEQFNAVNLRSVASVNTAFGLLNDIQVAVGKVNKNNNNSKFMQIMSTGFDWKFGTCTWSGGAYPMQVLIAIPDGRDSLARADYLVNPGWDWEYADNGAIIRAGRLYGDKNILSHNADPLQYLKFRCLPTEKVMYDIKDDPCVNSEYSGIAPVFLGIELEVEKKKDTPKKIEHMVAADLGMDYVVLKHDGSLQNGFEIVTAPATIGFHHQAWDKFFENSAKHLTSWHEGRCGMHVHISRAAFTPMHLGKLITFINNPENREFVTSIAGRQSTYGKYYENNSFQVKSKLVSEMAMLYKQLKAASTKKETTEIEAAIGKVRAKMGSTKVSVLNMLQDIEHGGERFSSVNLTKKGTVEIRIFRGNVMKIGMMKNFEFCHAAVQFTREATFKTAPLNALELEERKLKRKENTDYALHYTYFLDWLSKDTTGNYPNLKQWLQTHKMTDKFAKKKMSSKAPPDKRVTDDDIRACA